MASNVSVKDLSQCQPCLLEDIQEDYRGYCTECADPLCENCIKEHKKNKTSKRHAVFSFREKDRSVEIISYLKGLLTCKEHPEFELTVFCEDHKRYVCSRCLSTSHQKCTGLVSERKDSVDTNQTKGLSDEIQKIIKGLKEKTQHNKEQLKDRSERVAFQRKCVVDKLYEQIDVLDKKLQNEVDLLFNSEQEALRNDSEKLDELERQNDTLTQYMLHIEGKELPNKHLLLHEITSNLSTIKRNASSHFTKRPVKIVFFEGNNDMMSLGSVKKESDYEAEMSSACADSVETAEEESYC